MELSTRTVALLALATAVNYFDARGEQNKAATARAAYNKIQAGIAIDEHMAEVAELMISVEGISDEMWDEQTARIEANTATAVDELGDTAAGSPPE